MTTLTGSSPASTYRTLLKLETNSPGLTADLQQVEDGYGANTILQLSTTALNINNTIGNEFQLAGIALTATATEINSVCVDNTFLGTAAMYVPRGTTGQRPSGVEGAIRYNSTEEVLESYVNGTWETISTSTTGFAPADAYFFLSQSDASLPNATVLTATGTQIDEVCADGIFSGSAAVYLPIGTTGERPAGEVGAIRYNLTTGGLEGYIGVSWQTLAVVSGAAPSNATYITQTPSADLTNEQALSLLATGILKSTTATGVLSIAAAGTDYYSPGHPFTALVPAVNSMFLGTNVGNTNFSQGNVGFGVSSMSAIQVPAQFNTGVGYEALSSVSTGTGNSAFGYFSLVDVLDGSYNTGFGLGVLAAAVSGLNNSAFGHGAGGNMGDVSESCAFGYNSLLNNTSDSTCGFGAHALPVNQGESNAVFGPYGLHANTTGQNNCGFGDSVLRLNVDGESNNGFGVETLNQNVSGSRNNAFGAGVLLFSTNNDNSAFGDESFSNMTSGSGNTSLGSTTGKLYANYNNCTFIGFSADATVSGLTNATAIGAAAQVTTSNSLVLGNGANVGIGTSSPTSKLHVVGTSSMTGAAVFGSTVTLNADPVSALQAATKQYVDAISAGLAFKQACYAATTATLNATYLNGVSGVGATLINATTLAAFTVDGVSPPINSRILVKNQSSTFQNGCYVLTTVGSGAVAWILTRSTDYDQASEIVPGTIFAVDNGTANALTSWLETATVVTVGTDAITFSQFTFANPVTSVTGTSNRITSSGGQTPAIDIAATYVGQSSITTLGTITTGTWNGTLLAGTYGGTGVNNGASTITLAGNLVTSGANPLIFTTTGSTNVTFPTTGTLVNTAVTTLSSLVSIGTITTGTWTGTTIATANGGTGTSSPQATFTTVNVTGTSQAMSSNVRYLANNASLVTLTLPSSSTLGDRIEVVGVGAGGWKITQNSGNTIHIGSAASTTGLSGFIASTNQYDSLTLICTANNAGWVVLGAPQGNITVT